MATPATGSTAAGTITVVVGNVRIVGVDGVARVAKVGDKVFAREVIETGANGIIQVQLEGGRFLDLGRDSKLALTAEFLAEAGGAGATPAAPSPADAAALAKAQAAAEAAKILAGADPTQVTEATAAGGVPAAGGGADGGGGTPVVIDQANSTGEVTSGFPTGPAGIAFPEIEPALLPVVEGAPVVSVSVQVEVAVDVGGETPPPPFIPPTFPPDTNNDGVVVSGNVASLVEGTSTSGETESRAVVFVIKLDQVFDQDVQVTYTINGGIGPNAATPDVDYRPTDGLYINTVTIPAGETEIRIPLDIVQDHLDEEGDFEYFTIVLSDPVNATINPNASTAEARIFDDDFPPVANPDTNWAQEDAVNASGNVLQDQPHSGAPSGTFFDVADTDTNPSEVLSVTGVNGSAGNIGQSIAGTYGTLVLNANGTYTYTLDNTKAEVQALDTGETLSESFSYTITDGFNPQPNPATLAITIFGSNDVPQITVRADTDRDGDLNEETFGANAAATVFESGLATGSDALSNGESVTGSFKVADTDGLDDIDSVTINGQTVAIANLVGATFDGDSGVMTVTSFADGIANFTYELTTETTDGEGAETDAFTLTTSDGSNTSAPATVTIDIIDDVPTARNDSNILTEDQTSVSGNVRDAGPGADTQGADRPATVSGGTFEGEFGTLTLNSNGSYIYTLTVNMQGLDTGESVQEQFPYTLTDADGDHSNATLTITITGSNDGPVAVADTNWVQEDNEVNSTASGNVLMDIVHEGAPNQGLFQDLADTDVDIETLTVTTTGTFQGTYGSLQLNSDGSYTYTLNNENEDVQFLGEGDTLADSFNYTATDGTASAGATLTITIFGTNEGPRVGSDSTRVSEEGLGGSIPDDTPNPGIIDTTNSASSSGQISVSDSDGDPVTVTLSEPSGTLTSGGQTISWSGDGTQTLTGSISVGDEGTVDIITVTIDDDGNYAVTLLGPVDHSDPASEDNLSFTVGVNASDGTFTNSGSLLVTIEDDGPSIDVTTVAAADALVVDETNLAGNASANFADNFGATSNFGADGAGTINTSYGLSTAGGASGLTDVATGQNVLLFMNGSVVEGRTAVSNEVVFTVSVDGGGNVTLDQQRAVSHPNTTNPDDAVTLGNANLITLTRSSTITDRDGDTASDSAGIGIGQALSFKDDGPSIDVTTVAAADALVVDETNLAGNASANFADNFGATSNFGADGAGTINTSYGLSTAGGASGLTDVATGQNVLLFMNGSVVEGRTAVSNEVVFTVSVDGGGNVTLDQQRAVSHPNTTNPDDAVTLGNANLITLTRSSTITDRDGDTASDSAGIGIGQALSFKDDGPSIDVTTVAAADALVVDETNLAGNASANFADNFGATSNFGADGAGTINTSYGLSTAGGASGLTDVATGQNVLLFMNGSVVEGRTAVSNEVVFTVSVDGGGNVTLDQQRAVSHPNTTNPDDAVTLGNANLITLTRSSTITDRDGDTASDSAGIGIGQALSFKDDGPSIDVTTVAAADALVVDETNLAGNASANFADNFGATSNFGADGAGTINTSYGLSTAGGASGLTDVATGQNVLLFMNGSVVEGRTAVSNEVVFTVSVDGGGNVTLDQQRAVSHPNTTNPDDAVTLGNANLITLTRSSTITDRDGDTASDSAGIGIGQALSFKDDGPSIDVTTVAAADALVVDETNLAGNASANFADNFGATSNFGADGAGTINTSYGLSTAGGASGLTDVATGQNVLLFMNGSVVEGRTAVSNEVVFTVSVDGGGNVTLDQQRAVSHPNTTNPDDAVTLGNANLITLTRSSTITDRDGDTASDSAGIGIGQALSFKDDGPSIDVTTVAAADALVVDETNLAGNASANFADNFGATSNFGADGAGTINTSYGLSTAGGASGLADVATGQNVLLFMNGSVVEGRTAVSNEVVFTVSVDGGGNVTLDQQRAVSHPNTTNPDDAVTLGNANLITLTRSSTITDRDGDTASDSAGIGIGQALSFKDDGPSITASNIAIANVAGTYTGTYTFDVGADAQVFADSFAAGSLVWTNPRSGYELEYDAGASSAAEQVYHGTFNGGADTFFDLIVKSDGTYDITLVTPDPVTEVDVASILSGISGGSNLPSYTIGNAVFGGEFDVLLTGYSQGHVSDTLTISSTELGVGDNVMHGNKDDVLRFDIQPVGGSDAAISSLTIHVATTAGWKATDTVDTIVHYTTGPDTMANQVWGVDQQVVLNFDTARDVDWVEITPHGTDAFKIDGVSLSYLVTEFPDNYSLDFQLTGDDKDGDAASATFSVAVNTTDTSTYTIQGTSGADHVYGTTGNDILIAGDGSDILTGAAGADSFKWNAGDGDATIAPVDTVADFNQDPADKLDLSELLTGEDANAGSLSAYLHFTASGGNTTVEIKSTGAAGTVDQKIVLQGVDLTNGGAFNDSQIIQNLLTAGKLQTDV